MAKKLQEEPKYQFIEEEELKEFEAYYKQNGLENIADFMANKIKEAENVFVKVGVSGMAGTGKSTFINTFRGLTAEDADAAPVGVCETTTVPKEYHHPRNKNITLWDLPGIGTTQFNQENYEEKVNFGSYDFFLIFTNIRIFEDDIWLVKKAQILGKKYFIVRTHIDADISSYKLTHPRTHDTSQLLKRIRDNTEKLLQKEAVYPKDGVYLISTLLCHVDQWDYRKLEHDMLHVLPREKREVLTLYLSNLSEDLIKLKCQILRSRVWKKAIFLAAQGFVPSGFKHAAPQKVIDYFIKEMTSYRDALGLDDDSLRRLSQKTGVDLQNLITTTTETIELPTGNFTLEGVMRFIEYLRNPREIAKPALEFLLKLGRSYYDAYCLLHNILDRLESASLQVLQSTLPSPPHVEALDDGAQGDGDEA